MYDLLDNRFNLLFIFISIKFLSRKTHLRYYLCPFINLVLQRRLSSISLSHIHQYQNKMRAVTNLYLALLFAISLQAQETIRFSANSIIDPVFHTDANKVFITKIQNEDTPKYTRYFENVASVWGKQKTYQSGKSAQNFHASFKSQKGQLLATYDYTGKLIAAEEEFTNIALPQHLLKNLLETHIGWTIKKSTYHMHYSLSEHPKMEYNILLGKGQQEKYVRLDATQNRTLKVKSYATNN